MIIILVFLSDVLKVQPDLSIPQIKCFDENTLITMNDGTKKIISEIKTGDLLFENNEVTSVIKVKASGSTMYNLNNIIDRNWSLFACSALTGEGIQPGIEWLLTNINK